MAWTRSWARMAWIATGTARALSEIKAGGILRPTEMLLDTQPRWHMITHAIVLSIAISAFVMVTLRTAHSIGIITFGFSEGTADLGGMLHRRLRVRDVAQRAHRI